MAISPEQCFDEQSWSHFYVAKGVPQVLIDVNKKEKVYCGKYNALRGS